jgi:hypothetical protein
MDNIKMMKKVLKTVIKRPALQLKGAAQKTVWFILYVVHAVFNYDVLKINTTSRLSREDFFLLVRPNWYHDFAALGIRTRQSSDPSYREHQRIKQVVLFDYIDRSISLCRDLDPKGRITAVDLFCADGYFSNYAALNGVDDVTGVDLEEESGEGRQRHSVLAQARLITKLLGNEKRVTYHRLDVFDLTGSFDICICAGGLYHIADPRKLLELLNQRIKKYLIVQTVVSLERDDEDYFEAPAPGWTWGCRFSHKYLIRIAEESGWVVLRQDRNELTENKRLCDRGSSYLLLENKNLRPAGYLSGRDK